jgi:hypothetical protein
MNIFQMQKRTQYYATFESFVEIRIRPSVRFQPPTLLQQSANTADEGPADFQSDFLSGESRSLTRWFIADV